MSTERQDNLKQRCDCLLTVLLGKDQVDTWWNSSHSGMYGAKPIDVFTKDPERVYNYLMNRIGNH